MKTPASICRRAFACFLFFVSSGLHANPVTPLTMCVFDFVGVGGPVHEEMKSYQIDAVRWGVDLSLKVYTDDRVASEEFKNGVCDMLNLPDIRAREYNDFTGSISAVGALPTYEHLGIVIKTLSHTSAADFMRQGDYEIVGIAPIGAVFLFVNDTNIHAPRDLAAKRITVLENAPATVYIAKNIGMTPVSSGIRNALQKFNNRVVDVTGAPALAYEPMEMYKGLEPNGGIIKWPTLQITMQLIVRWQKVPEGFGQNSRDLMASKYHQEIREIEQSEVAIPEKYWINISDEAKNEWNDFFRQARITLRGEGVYHPKALKLFARVRCKLDPLLAECTAKDQE
jgi:Solute-binding protein AdeT 1/2